MQELNLSWNRLETLPKEIGELKELRWLDLSWNRLKTLSNEIGELKNLQVFHLCRNRLETLSKGIGELKRLQELHIYWNQLKTLPKEIRELKKLKVLDLSGNRLETLPKEIGGLANLRGLYLYENRLKTLPNEIGGLKVLQELYLSGNRLRTLPNEIGELKVLQELYLSGNRLEALPEEIGMLTGLRTLNLSGTGLRSLPASIRNLSNTIILLNLSDANNLLENGEGDALGWRQLMGIFGDHLYFSDKRNKVLPPLVAEEEVYEKMNKKALHWNVKKLKLIKEDPIPKHKHDGKYILKLFRRKLKEYEPESDSSNKKTIENYIKVLYKVEDNTFGIWEMYEELVETTKDMLEAIFLKMAEKVDSRIEDEINDVKSYLSVISEGVKYCPDGQISRFSMIYSALYSRSEFVNSIEDFVKQRIAFLKNYIFGMTVTPGTDTQNVHVLNYWKHELREELGLNALESKLGLLLGQDYMFGGNPGNVLDAFYSKFTENYVIKEIMRSINVNQKMLNESGSFLINKSCMKGKELHAYLENLFVFEGDKEDFIYTEINEKGVEEILVWMEILIRTA